MGLIEKQGEVLKFAFGTELNDTQREAISEFGHYMYMRGFAAGYDTAAKRAEEIFSIVCEGEIK